MQGFAYRPHKKTFSENKALDASFVLPLHYILMSDSKQL